MKKEQYGSDSIYLLEGLEGVRMRPGMYIGDTSIKGFHHMLWEIIDNSIDEIANGYGDKIDIVIRRDNSVSVSDNGRGIPVDIHKKAKIPAVELVFTSLHSGAKFDKDASYKFSGGLHGVGSAVVNALSKWLNVTVYRDGKSHTIEFYAKETKSKVIPGAKKSDMVVKSCSKKLHGTTVEFLPDEKVFGNIKFSFDIINKRIRELAFLNNMLKISLVDEREIDEATGTPKRVDYHFKGGLVDFVKYQNDSKKVLYQNPLYFLGQYNYNDGKDRELEVKVAMQHQDGNESISSFVNNIPTVEGGIHEQSLKTGITKAMNEYAKSNGIIKDKDTPFIGDDFREGLTVIITVNMANPEFEGQTKAKLSNTWVRKPIEDIVSKGLSDALKKCTKQVINDIYDKAFSAKRDREKLQNSKDMSKKMKEIAQNKLVGKLAQCTGKDTSKNELFIVEGDSAGGSAKNGRDSKFQAILPLKGKPLNVEKAKLDKALDNDEICTIISALGTGINKNFDIKNLKYDKIIILADADQDGAHIRAILLTFFYRYMKPLITEGHVYIGMPPLYKVENKGEVHYVYDDEKLKELLSTMTGKKTMQRYKGLGEMNPEQLWETTMNPENRALIKVSIEDNADADRLITTLMGDNATARKEYIYNNANFNKIDEYDEIGG